MNNTVADTEKLLTELAPLVADAKHEIVVCVPFTALATAAKMTKGTNIGVGAQNVSWADSGAFTGEISADMILETGAKYVIIGHSERRQMFGETDATVAKRTKQAIAKGLTAIVCVGETLDEREKGITNEIVARQVKEGLCGLTPKELEKIVIAYEPVWAIGTGKTASAKDAQDTVLRIRLVLVEMFGKNDALKLRIQYGGSMNPANVDDLMAQPDIDGGLIGGASLKAADFARIVNFKK